MNRRTFFKGVIGSLLAVIGLRSDTEANPILTRVDNMPGFTRELLFRTRKVRSIGRHIWWSEVEDDGIYFWTGSNYADLPTYDTCRYLFCRRGEKLYWIGRHEIWEIIPTGDVMVFQFRLLGDVEFVAV